MGHTMQITHSGIDISAGGDTHEVHAAQFADTSVIPPALIASGYVVHKPDGSVVNVITEVHDRKRFNAWMRDSRPIP